MNKDVVLALIDKDIKELEVLSKGFAESESISPLILGLAKAKATNILNGINCLAELGIESVNNSPQATILNQIVEEDVAPILNSSVPVEEDAAKKHVEPVQISEVKEDEIKTESALEVQKLQPDVVVDVVSTPLEKELKQSLAEILNADAHSLNDTLTQHSDQSLANVLSSTRIEDLRQAVSLADRFRFQRELFQGNGEKFNTALGAINGMKTEQEALDYIATFGWSEDNECVDLFRQLIRRKFL